MQNETRDRNSPTANSSIYPVDANGDKLILFPGKIVRRNGALAFHGALAQFFLTVAMGKAVWLKKVSEQEEVCVGVSAKYIRIDGGSSNDDVYISGNVERKSFCGSDNCINVRIGKDRVIVKSENHAEFNHGDDIRLNFSRSNAILFRCSADSINQEAMHLALSAV
ncbi:MAG: hypothetical protein C4542_00665 [Dehalococcoidia bacterium]|nr:MAG: hypothetical protein C4542_00665 [Dehalococcoidia bacterium]